MKVEYSARARFDLAEIGTYTELRSPAGAVRVRNAIRRSIDLLTAFPWRGRNQKSRDVRRIGAGRYPYHIYYRVDEIAQVVTILSIYHVARRPRHKST